MRKEQKRIEDSVNGNWNLIFSEAWGGLFESPCRRRPASV